MKSSLLQAKNNITSCYQYATVEVELMIVQYQNLKTTYRKR